MYAALVFLFLVLAPDAAKAVRGRYAIGDWVSWTSMREVNDIEEYLNVLYVATNGGVARYDLMAKRWKNPLTTSDGLIGRRILAIHVDRSTGNLIYRTPQGISSFTSLSERNDDWHRATPEIERLLTAPEPMVPARNAIPPPLYHFRHGVLIDKDLREYRVADTVVDFWDNMWLAIRGVGVGMIEWDTSRLQIIAYSLWNDDVRAISRLGDTFWFVGHGAINAYNRADESWNHYEAFNILDLHSDDVQDVLVDSAYVWLATSHGLSRFDRVGERWRTFTAFDGLPENDVRTIASDTGAVWIGTKFGVARLDRRGFRVMDVSTGTYAERTVNDIAVGDGTVWVGTDLGLRRSDDRGATWRRFTADEPILDAAIYVIALAGEELWCASRLGVIGYNTRRGSAQRFPAGVYFGADSIGGPTKQIYSLLAADSLLWIGANAGVYRYDRRRGSWRTFTVEDGLIDNRVYDIEHDGDYLWFATPRGVTRFFWNNPYRVDW